MLVGCQFAVGFALWIYLQSSSALSRCGLHLGMALDLRASRLQLFYRSS